MAYNYTRQSSISDGDTITAALFNNEYNQLVNAFAYSSSSAGATGHRHDGTAGQGGSVHTIGDLDFLNKIVVDSTNNRWGVFVEVSSAAVEQVRIQDGAVVPVTDNDIDLGTSSLEFKDAYFDGTVTSDAFAGPLTGNVTGNVSGTAATVTTAAQSNITSLGTLTTLTVDNVIINGTTIGHTSDTDLLTLTSGVLTVAGEVDATSLDISGDADIDGTLEADAITIGGVTLAETISDTVGAMVSSNTETNITVTYEDSDNTLDFVIGTLNQDTTGLAATATALATARTIGGTSFDGTANIAVATATEGTNVTVSANNSTDETVYPTFVDGATGTQGIETDTGLTYNPSTGMLTTTGVTSTFTGNITGNVTGNTSGTAATVTTAAQSNITSLGTLTALTVDNLGINGNTITANSGALNLTPAAGSAIVLDGTINVDAGVVTGATAITLSGELDAGSLDISGDADIDGTLEADAITIGGVTLAETIADTVGAMVSSNTESGITVAYQDADNTLDFTVGTLNQDTTGTAATVTGGTQASITAAANLVTVGTIGTGVWQGTAIASAYIAADAITGAKIADDAINSEHYTDGSIDTAHIADSQITQAKMAADSIDSSQYVDGSIDTAHIADSQITSAKLADGTIATADIADNAITLAKMASGTDGNIISFDASGNPVAIATGTDGQILTSTGAGSPPAFEDAASGGASDINGLSDAKTFGTSSIMIGDATTGTIDGANYNVGLGVDVFSALTSGDSNIAIGFDAADTLTTGSHNIAIGTDALGAAGSGVAQNIMIGYNAGSGLTGDGNVAIGHTAFDAAGDRDNCVAIGAAAGTALTTADECTAVGSNALAAQTTSSNNTAIGFGALSVHNATSSGVNNLAVGHKALYAQTYQEDNVAVGGSAMAACNNNSTSQNTAVGAYALPDSGLAGYGNVAVGYYAGQSCTSALSNTLVGRQAGNNITTGDENVNVGYLARPDAAGGTGQIVVGYNIAGKGNATGLLGGASGVYNEGNTTAFSQVSDERIKKNITNNNIGLDAINKIQVKNFEYRTEDEVTELPKQAAIKKEGNQVGVIAQEIQEILPDLVKEQTTGCLSVNSDNLTWYLINAVQELSAEIKKLKGE
jgi:cytoskeletal protein CcmA (bactofilin family)